MAFEARIGVGDTIAAMNEVGGLRSAVLWLEAADGDIGDVVAEWSGEELVRALAGGGLVESELQRSAYLLARNSGAFDMRERAYAAAAAAIEDKVLLEMRGDLVSSQRPWEAGEDEEWLLGSAMSAAKRLLVGEGGPLASAPRGIRHDAVEHLAGYGLAAEAAFRAGPEGRPGTVGDREVRLVATAQGGCEIRLPDGIRHANGIGEMLDDGPEIDEVEAAEAVRAYLAAEPGDVAAAAYASMVARSRAIGRAAAELEARATVLLDERDDLVAHMADVMGTGRDEPPAYPQDELPAPRF